MTLAAISAGAVFMGANTYIGNAPNFMVYAIARQQGVEMPSFFGYMLWSGGRVAAGIRARHIDLFPRMTSATGIDPCRLRPRLGTFFVFALSAQTGGAILSRSSPQILLTS